MFNNKFKIIYLIVLLVPILLYASDEGDDLIEMVQCNSQPFEDVQPLPGAGEVKLTAPPDDLQAVVDVDHQCILQTEHLRLTVHQGQHLHAEGRLQLGVFQKLTEHLPRMRAPLEFDHNAHPAPVGFIPQIGNIIDLALPHQLGDALDQGGVLVLDLLALQSGQARQAHVEDRLGLHLAQTEAFHEGMQATHRAGRRGPGATPPGGSGGGRTEPPGEWEYRTVRIAIASLSVVDVPQDKTLLWVLYEPEQAVTATAVVPRPDRPSQVIRFSPVWNLFPSASTRTLAPVTE